MAAIIDDQPVDRPTWAASTWRIETTWQHPELSIGSYLPLCGEIQNNADSRGKAEIMIDRYICRS
jgi:hypothetical protein